MTRESDHPALRAIGRALPSHYYDQQVLSAALWEEWGGDDDGRRRFERIHRAVGVRGRHLALPLEEYRVLGTFARANEAWVHAATDLSESAIRLALCRAGLEPRDVDHIFFTTVTGIASPSIDAKLINRLGMRADVKRTPLFGLGCVGGAAGVARAADYLRAFPDHIAILVAVELCSLTLQVDDRSTANVIASALFGDGAAAVALAGGARPPGALGPRVVASRSMFFHETEELMGWRVVDGGFQVMLGPGVPDLVRRNLRPAVDAFLGDHDLAREDVSHWLVHTGGPKVLRAMEESLALPADALARSWRSLESIGNLSSVSVLHVAADLLESRSVRPGEYGMLLSMGPGFCGELVLLRW